MLSSTMPNPDASCLGNTGKSKNESKLASRLFVKYSIYIIFDLFLAFRFWNNLKTKNYVLDLVTFESGFDSKYFEVKFNPRFPMAVLKFDTDLWIVLLPCRRRQVQGQILYRYCVPFCLWHLESCQWSGDGKKLLILIQTDKSAIKVLPDLEAKDQVKALLFLVSDFRGRYIIKEIKNSVQSIPSCHNSLLLSGNSK